MTCFFNQVLVCLKSNFGPLKRGSLTHPMLITVLLPNLTQRSPEEWVPKPNQAQKWDSNWERLGS